jgi:glycosyltransferase involved in cell wall biosynthesis
MYSSSPRICLVAHFAYGALAGGKNGHIGGVEWQTSLTAKWLAARGYDVSMITWDDGQPDDERIDGVRVIKLCRRDAGLPIVRFVHPRWTSLNRALRAADADVYYQNCGEYVTGQVALWCKRHGRGFVYSVANDADCDAALPEMKTLRERVLYRYGLRRADSVIAQTLKQSRMLADGFKRASIVIPMPCRGLNAAAWQPPAAPRARQPRVLWLARITRQKRPDRYLELARECPEIHFDLVGPSDESEFSTQVLRDAEKVENLTVHGPAKREQLPAIYSQADCFCCTSDFEGFPNTFLEAWSGGLPIVSTFDPDGVIARHELGILAGDVPALADGLRKLLNEPERWRTAAANAYRYYYENHRIDAVMPRFERIFCDLAAARHNGRNSE